MASEPTPVAAEQAVTHLAPTLLIGLGGTGKDVLLRIRRMFYERYGRRADGTLGFPIVGYLALDTDPKAFDRIEGESPSDFVLRNIWFKEGGTPEALACTLDARQVEDYFKHGEQKAPHIARWLPPGLMKFGANGIVDGAGQNRLFGRLAFFHHIPTIFEALKARVNQIVADATLPEAREKWVAELRHPVRVDPRRLNVILVYSLAGGTGSGMFLDMSFLVRHVLTHYVSLPDIQAFFTHFAVTPEAFIQEAAEHRRTVQLTPDQRRKIQENAFACLREMEFFSMRQAKSHDLTIPPAVAATPVKPSLGEPWYTVRYRIEAPLEEEVEIRSAPWDTCYLVGGGNDNMGAECLPPSEVNQMIADRIFLQFDGGQFASKDSSEKSNVERTFGTMNDKVRDATKENPDEILYTHELSRRFSTFGLAQLYFDRERMRRAASHRLAWKLVAEWWLRPCDHGPVEMQQAARDDLIGDGKGVVTRTGLDGDRPIPLGYSALRDRILIENADEDRQRTWFHVIDEERQRRAQDVENGRYDDGPEAAVRPFLHDYLMRLKRDRHTRGETGLAARAFERNRQLLEPEIDARLRCLFLYRLDQLGARGALQLLDACTTVYKEELDRAQRMTSLTRSAMPAWEARVHDAGQIPLPSYARSAVRVELTRAVRQAREHLQKRFHHEAIADIKVCLDRAQEQIAPAKRQASYTERLRRFLDVLEAQSDGLTGAQHYLARRFGELRQPASSRGRTVGLLDNLTDAEYDLTIRNLIAPQSRAATLDMAQLGPEVERKVLAQLRASKERWRGVHSLGELVLMLFRGGDATAQQAVDDLAGDLAEACEALLAGFAADTSALQQFNKETGEKKVRIDCLRIYSGCYLKIARSSDRQEIDAPTVKRLGIANSKSPAADAFRRDLEQSGGGESLVGLQPFDIEDDTLVLYQEKAGIPLCYAHDLEAMGRMYDASDRQEQTHLDYQGLRGRLPEIRRVNPERQKHLAACLELTLYGIVTGLLTYRRDRDAGGRFWMENRDEYGGTLPVPVGEQFEDVVHHLAEDRADRTELEAQVETWLRKSASRNDGQNLVLLWCAVQDLVALVRERVAANVAARRLASAREERKDPTILRTLKERMLPAVRKRVESLPQGAHWLATKLDLFAVLRDEDLEPEEKKALLRGRAELLEGCFRTVSDELPIPVIQPKARLDEKAFGDLGVASPVVSAARPRPSTPLPPSRPSAADATHRPHPAPVPRDEDGDNGAAFKRPEDYDE